VRTALHFSHDTEHQRFKQVAPDGVTTYFDAFGVRAERFAAGTERWNDYLMVGGKLIALRVYFPDTEVVNLRYFHKDHLGSIAVMTDETGTVIERFSYDAWASGASPMAPTTPPPASSASPLAATPATSIWTRSGSST
jgi:hypothetical protein